MTSAEDIARRFERRPGFELIDYGEVVLPIYRLVVDAITLVRKEVPPIQEFVMRSVAAGFESHGEIAAFLGLDDLTVRATIGQLRDATYIHVSDNGGRTNLLDRGKKTLKQTYETQPQDEMLVFLYDRLLRRPVWLGTKSLLMPSHVDSQQTIEIRPYPADGPDITELSLPAVTQTLQRQAGGQSEFGKDILQLKRIVRRVRLYRLAVALVYKKLGRPDIQVAFIVDDARDEGLEHAFAAGGGPKKMGLVRSIQESATAAELKRHIGSKLDPLLPEATVLDEKRVNVSTARLKHQIAIQKFQRASKGREIEAKQALRAAELAAKTLDEAERDLQTLAVRHISPYEASELLGTAITNCQRFLSISTRDLSPNVVNRNFIKQLEAALSRGVKVLISLSDITTPTRGRRVVFDPNAELQRMQQKYMNLKIHLVRHSRYYHVIKDNEFALIINRPMLGNLGKVKSFQHVIGILIQEPELVQAYTAKIEKSPTVRKTRGHR